MQHRIKLVLTALSFSAVLSACGDTATQPRTADGTEIRRIPLEPLEPVDPGDGGGGTPTTTEPFNPPPPLGGILVPVSYDGVRLGHPSDCLQRPHARVAFSNDVVRGTTLYPTGVVVPSTKANFHFYNAQGQLVKTHLTHHSHDNCVIQHEPEAMSTWDLAPGYYHIYANFWTLPFFTSGIFTGYPLEHGTVYVGPLRIR